MKVIMTVAMVLLMLLPVAAEDPKPNKPKFDPVAQAHALREAKIMASRGRCAHYLGCAPGARFSGVGMSTNPNPRTCEPWRYGSSARKLIADAIVYRNGRYYRSRHWR